MKKLFAFLFLGLFMISFASAWNWDNTYDYNPNTDEVMIENAFGFGDDLAYLKLVWGDTTVARGVDQHVGTFNMTLLTENLTDVFEAMDLVNLKNGQVMTRGKQYKVKEWYNESVDDYERQCEEFWNETNNSYSEVCTQVEIGSHIELKYKWMPISNPNFNFIKGIEYEIGVFVDVEKGDYGDWRPSLYGVTINEWSTWTESLNSGLKAWWKFDEQDTTGTGTIIDSLGNFNGTNNGADNTTGRIKTAYDYEVSNTDNINIGNLLSMVDLTSNGTISMWVTVESYPASGQFPFEHNAGSNSRFYIFCPSSSGCGFAVGSTGTANYALAGLNEWVHFLGTWDGSELKFYINGTLKETKAYTTGGTGDNTFWIGGSSSTTDRYWDGKIDETGIWNRTLDITEVQQLYNNGSGISYTDTFGTSPDVVLVSPVDDFNSTIPTISFNVNVTDSQKVDNVTLYIDGVANETNSSGINGSYSFTKLVSFGTHNWSILAWNNQSLSNQSETRTFNYTDQPPSVVLVSPANDSAETSNTVSFQTTVTDNIAVANVSLFIDGVINESNTSGVNGSYTFTKILSDGPHNWSILAEDSVGLINQSKTRILNVSPTAITINLLSPADALTSQIPLVNVSCSAEIDGGVTQLNLTINGIVNLTVVNSTVGQNLTAERIANFSEGNYNWSCSAKNGATSSTSSNRTFDVLYSNPIVTLTSPPNNTNQLNSDFTFVFSATDLNGISNATLYIDGVANETNSSGVNGSYSFTKNLSDGSHNWSATAVSIFGKSTTSATRFVSVHTTAPNITITEPSGSIDYIFLGNNQTLTYSITETGFNSTHFDSCWYYYPTNNNLSTSDFSSGSRWNFINGTMSGSNGPNVLRTGFNFGSGEYSLSVNSATNNLESSNFVQTIPDCNIQSYDSTVKVYSSSTVGYYTCIKNTDTNEIYLIQQDDYDSSSPTVSNFTSYNIRTDTLNCSATTDTFTYINLANNLTIFANDTFGLLANKTTTWQYKVAEANQTFNAVTTEGTTETFVMNYYSNESPTSVNLVYEDVFTSASIDATQLPLITVTANKIIPGVASQTNLSFLWQVTAASGVVNTTLRNQTVNTLAIDNCSNFTNVFFNYTMIDEATQTFLNATSESTSFEIELLLYTSDKSSLVVNFSQLFNETNPVAICSETGLFNGTDYIVDSTVKFTSNNRSIEYYNIRDFAVTNETTTQNITLYNIKIDEATDFQLTFKDSNFVVVEDALIQVNRQYVSEGIFKTVEIPITDSNGQTVVHLVQNDVVYNFIVTKNNVILGTFNNLIAFCEDATVGQCYIELNSLEGTEETFNADEDLGVSTAFSYNDTTRNLDLTFTTTDGSIRNIVFNAVKMDQIGNSTVCSTSITSSSGSLTCNVPASIGNETIITNIFVDGELVQLNYFSADNDLDLGDGGYFLMLFLVISLGLMFSSSKSMTVAGVILGFISSSLLMFIKGGIIATGSAVMWLIVMGIVLIWKLQGEGQT